MGGEQRDNAPNHQLNDFNYSPRFSVTICQLRAMSCRIILSHVNIDDRASALIVILLVLI